MLTRRTAQFLTFATVLFISFSSQAAWVRNFHVSSFNFADQNTCGIYQPSGGHHIETYQGAGECVLYAPLFVKDNWKIDKVKISIRHLSNGCFTQASLNYSEIIPDTNGQIASGSFDSEIVTQLTNGISVIELDGGYINENTATSLSVKLNGHSSGQGCHVLGYQVTYRRDHR